MYYTRIFYLSSFRGYAVRLRIACRGWGMIPLSSRAAAKGRKSTTQLAAPQTSVADFLTQPPVS